MKNIKTYITEKFRITNKIRRLKPQTTQELKDIINERYNENNDFVELSDVDVSAIEDWNFKDPKNCGATGLFFFMDDLKEVDVTGWDMRKCRTMKHMFDSCERLEKIHGIDKWDVSNVENMAYMFYGCKKLTEAGVGDLTKWKLNEKCVTFAMFDKSGIDLPELL